MMDIITLRGIDEVCDGCAEHLKEQETFLLPKDHTAEGVFFLPRSEPPDRPREELLFLCKGCFFRRMSDAIKKRDKERDKLARQLEEEVVRAGINYVNALDGEHESPFTPAEFLVTLKDQIRKVMQTRFGDS
jgi:hypothetical protein